MRFGIGCPRCWLYRQRCLQFWLLHLLQSTLPHCQPSNSRGSSSAPWILRNSRLWIISMCIYFYNPCVGCGYCAFCIAFMIQMYRGSWNRHTYYDWPPMKCNRANPIRSNLRDKRCRQQKPNVDKRSTVHHIFDLRIWRSPLPSSFFCSCQLQSSLFIFRQEPIEKIAWASVWTTHKTNHLVRDTIHSMLCPAILLFFLLQMLIWERRRWKLWKVRLRWETYKVPYNKT